MLRASVSLSRNISHDGNSWGYTVSLDGDIPHVPDDAEGVLEKVSELFHLAEEALAVEIERDKETPSSRNAGPPQQKSDATKGSRREALPINCSGFHNETTQQRNSATSKQLQFLESLRSRKGLSPSDLDGVIAQVLGSAKHVADLTRREAGQMIAHLTNLQPEESR